MKICVCIFLNRCKVKLTNTNTNENVFVFLKINVKNCSRFLVCNFVLIRIVKRFFNGISCNYILNIFSNKSFFLIYSVYKYNL